MNDRFPESFFTRGRRWLVQTLARAFAGFVLVYLGFLALGCVPVNSEYAPPPASDSVVIFIRHNEIHTDFVLPVEEASTGRNWHATFPPADFQRDVSQDEFVAIGWGNFEFFVNTPTWADFRLSTALRGLFTPSESVLHVEYLPTSEAKLYREVRLSRAQYGQLCAFIDATIVKRNGAAGDSANDDTRGATAAILATPKSHGAGDRFYVSTGTYHLFNTCNQWTGRGLKQAGVKTGLWTPLQQQVLYWLPPPDEPTDGIKF